MKPLLKLIFIMLVFFGAVFMLTRATGLVTIEVIEGWLDIAREIDPLIFGLAIVGLLFIDLFITVPTLSLALLAGYFLGFGGGIIAVALGIAAAGLAGYAIGRRWGATVIAKIIRDPVERQTLPVQFHQHGPVMIMLARAAPMLPEITACLAGATKMPLARFGRFFAIGNGPYVLLTVYAGSVSSIDDPTPAIYAVLFVYAVTWSGWLVVRRQQRGRG